MIINTVNTKSEQLRNTYYKIGSGKEVILIIGSCRCVPYMNYFNTWNFRNSLNEGKGDRFTIAFVDPYNFYYDLNDNRIDLEEKINSLETDERLLGLLKSTKIFIHEFYNNFGMFNCDKDAVKNIYQFGLKPEIDICLPNFNDVFILCGDIVSFDMDIRKKAIADYNVIGKLSEQTAAEIYEISQRGFEKFYSVCRKSDLPEMELIFKAAFRTLRFYWNSNHISKHFTLNILMRMNEKYLKLDLDDNFWYEISEHDMYANNFTYLTEYDMAFYNYQWNEEVKPLKEKL